MGQGILSKAGSVQSDVALVLMILLLLSGLGLVTAYFAPEMIAQAFGGATILVIGITFAGTLLVWLSILPADEESTEESQATTEAAT